MSVNIEYGPLYCGYFDDEKVAIEDLRFFATLTGVINHALKRVGSSFFKRSTANFKLFKLTHARWQQELALEGDQKGYYFTHCDEPFETLMEAVTNLSLVKTLAISDSYKSTWTLVNKPNNTVTLIDGVAVECDEVVYLDFLTSWDGNTVLIGVKTKYGENHVWLTNVMTQQLKTIVEMCIYVAILEVLENKGVPYVSKNGKETTHVFVIDVRQLCSLIYKHGTGSDIVRAISNEIVEPILAPLLRRFKENVDLEVNMNSKDAYATIAITCQ